MRLKPGSPLQGAYGSLLKFAKDADAEGTRELGALLVELIKLRVSQINGCAYCLRQHSRDALELGESPDRLAVLSSWAETQYFSEVERAALELAESITLVTESHVDDETYAAAVKVLSREQLLAVMWVTSAMNALNRQAITCRYDVGPAEPKLKS